METPEDIKNSIIILGLDLLIYTYTNALEEDLIKEEEEKKFSQYLIQNAQNIMDELGNQISGETQTISKPIWQKNH
jgi:hypothetical protein